MKVFKRIVERKMTVLHSDVAMLFLLLRLFEVFDTPYDKLIFIILLIFF